MASASLLAPEVVGWRDRAGEESGELGRKPVGGRMIGEEAESACRWVGLGK